jgi:hypothetical protein
MKKLLRLFALALPMVLITSNSYAAVKAGSACSKVGSKSVSGGKSYTCIKSGKKLVWDKGVAIPKTPATPTTTTTKESGSSTTTTNTSTSYPITKNLSPISECKITDQRTHKAQPNNVGFPITKQEIPITGITKAIFLPVDFADAPGVGDPSIRTTAIAAKMNSWFTHFSSGKFNIEAQHSKTWFHSSLKSATIPNIHPMSTGSNESAPLANSLAQEWIDLSGSTFDFTGVTTIFFEFPESVKGFGDGTQGRNVTLKTKQGNIQVMFNIMGDSWFYEGFMGVSNKFRADHFWSFYIHEMFHSMGLPQHAPGNGIPLSIGSNQTGTPEGFAGVLDPWELFLLGWLDDSSVFCASKNDLVSANVILSPLDVNREGTKTAIVQISNHQALVISSRRSEEWSAELPKGANGILVYEVDTTRDRNEDGVQADASGADNGNNPAYSKWAFYLLPDGVPGGYAVRRGLTDYILKKGQSVTFEGVTVTYLDAGQNDTIQIAKSK